MGRGALGTCPECPIGKTGLRASYNLEVQRVPRGPKIVVKGSKPGIVTLYLLETSQKIKENRKSVF